MNSVGVIVARFQTPYLHKGHRALIDYVKGRHETVLVFIGDTGKGLTSKDPLDYYSREAMLLTSYPDLVIATIVDCPGDDVAWSQDLDTMIKMFADGANVTIYGGRNSVVDAYTGIHPTHRVPHGVSEAATNVRRAVEMVESEQFRRGMIYAVQLMEKAHE